MKIHINTIATTVILIMVIFTSCNKDDVNASNFYSSGPTGTPYVYVDTLSGHEYIFNDLIWKADPEFGFAFISIGNRFDLFFNANRSMEVSLKPDSSTIWLDVQKYSYPAPPGENHYYGIYLGSMYISLYRDDQSLIGRSASLKIKF